MKTYKIEITPLITTGGSGELPYFLELTTDDIKWSMEQYQRNREAFDWEIIEVNEYEV